MHKIFWGLLLCGLSQVQAQNAPDSLPANATRLEPLTLMSYSPKDSVLRAPASVGIITARDLQRGDLTDISVPMNRIPGVFMQSSNIATNRISIRGIGARTPYGTNKIRAFYGNIPLTSGDSETTIEDLDLSQIQRVTVIKGPMSSLYGAGLGGAILLEPISTKNKGHELSTQNTFGSFGLLKQTYRYALQNTQNAFNVGYHKLETDGWRDNSAYRRDGVTLTAEAFKNRRNKLVFLANYTNLKAFIPSSIDRNTFEQHPRAAATTWAAAQGYKAYETVLGGLSFEGKIDDRTSHATAIFANYKDNYEPRPFDILGQYTFGYGARTQGSFERTLAQKPLHLQFGAEYFADRYHASTAQNLYRNNNANGSLEGQRLTALAQFRQFYNLFAQARFSFSKEWEAQAGLSFNHTWFTLEDRYPRAQNTSYDYSPIWSPQLSVLWYPAPNQSVYASVSRGFSLPSIDETRNAQGNINTAIQPERGMHYELGSKWHFLHGKLYTELALFHMDIDNLLVAERVAEDQYQGRNAGKTRHQGAEVSLSGNFPLGASVALKPTLALTAGRYEFREFTDNGNNYRGNELTGVPAQLYNAQIEFSGKSGWFVFGSWQYVDGMPLDDANAVFTDSYQLLQAKTGWRFPILRQLECLLAAGVNNIGDSKYAALILPNAVAAGSSGARSYYPGLPVNYYAETRLCYRF